MGEITMQDLDKRLAAATTRRSALLAEKQKITGRLEAARKQLQGIEDECRAKKVEPAKLGATIETLRQRYTEQVEKLEAEVEAAEVALQPFMKES